MKRDHSITIIVFLFLSCPFIRSSYPFDLYGSTPLVQAAAYDHSDYVTYLMESWLANPDETDKWGDSPLVTALRYNCCDTVAILLAHGARASQRDSKTFPLCRAVKSGCYTCVEAVANHLQESGHLFPFCEQKKLFRRAKKTGHPLIAKLLIDRGFVDPVFAEEEPMADGKLKTLVLSAVAAKRGNISRVQDKEDEENQPATKRAHREKEAEENDLDTCLICSNPLPKDKSVLFQDPRFTCDHAVVCIQCKKIWIKTREAQQAHNTNPDTNFAPTCPLCRAKLK